ncbi:MAG: hypothetical protein HQ582_34165, partial [Planctomycetes bacterium]|nr:hypothetical protein [Planctomycetota bacterium]
MRHVLQLLPGLAILLGVPGVSDHARADHVLLLVKDAPADELAVATVDLTGAARWCKVDSVEPNGVRAVTVSDGRKVPFQFVPDADYDPRNRIVGTVVFRLPQGSDGRLRLEFGSTEPLQAKPWDGTVRTSAFVVEHDPKKEGGLPSAITFPETGKRFDSFHWNDRVYDREKGWFGLRNDPQPSVELVARGPLCTVVRVRARYMKSADEQPASRPEAVYHWHYFHDQPLIYVRAEMRQEEPYAWPEHHFLELNYPREAFPRWAGGEPLKEGEFTVTRETFNFPQWGALVDGPNALAMFNCGQAMFYDAGTGTYLHAHGNSAWAGWREEQPEFAAWLWIGSDEDAVAAIQAAAGRRPTRTRVAVTADGVRARIETARKELEALDGSGRAGAWWRALGATQLESEGRLDEAVKAAAGETPPAWKTLAAGELGVILEETGEGVDLINLFDLATGGRLLVPESLPLFKLTLRHAETKEEVNVEANVGWKQVDIARPAWEGMIVRWRRPKDDRLGDLSVEVGLKPDHATSALRWTLHVENPSKKWSVWRAVFPQVAVADLGAGASVFFPRAAGEVKQGLWQQGFRFQGTYPSGWTSMPFMAAYDENQKTGLYVASHDPLGSTKDIL